MKILSSYPLVTVRDLPASRAFFIGHFGFEAVFEASWVVMLGREAGGAISLGLMAPDHPTEPPGSEAFDGRGMIVTVEVEDAAEACAALRRGGAPIVYDLHDEPWGQRRFMTVDPSGILVDVVEQIEPTLGYWERFAEAPAA